MDRAACFPKLARPRVPRQVAALRVLAVLGENELVWRAVGRPPIQGRGLRILSMGEAPAPAWSRLLLPLCVRGGAT